LKKTLLLLALATSIYAYEGCGKTKEDALLRLTGNIISRVSNETTINDKSLETSSGSSSVHSLESKIAIYTKTSSNLTLVEITYTKKKDEQCASVKKEAQSKNTKQLLDKALGYKQSNIPSDIDEKIKTLDKWITDINKLSYLIPTFLEDKTKEQDILNKKEKVFKDLYTDAIKKSNSLVWKECQGSKEEAKAALNKLIFKDKGVKEDTGFFSSLFSAFKSTKTDDIDLFDRQILYVKNGSKNCALIKKDDLRKITLNMNNEVKRFSQKTLSKNPVKRYNDISIYEKEFILIKKLISLFPQTFKNNDFSNLDRVNEILRNTKETTFPQFVIFNIANGTDVQIKLDDKFIDNKKKYYIKTGEHSYTITTKDRCPMNGTFDNDLKENETISKDFNDYKFPTVNFSFSLEGRKPNIVIDGKNYDVNKQTPIATCRDEDMPYIATYSGQTRKGTISLNSGERNSIELKFLTVKELEIFNNATTLNFKTTTKVKFSETLTSQTSQNLVYSVAIGDGVSHGSLDVNKKGSFVYQSDDNFVGIDSFTYTITANGEDSAPKVVNITVEHSIAPVVIVPIVTNDNKEKEKKKKKKEELEKAQKKQEQEKLAQEKIKQEKKKEEEAITKKEEVKETEIKEVTEEEKEEKYQRFKKYVDSQEQDIEKLQKLQKSYPELFERLLKEKTGQ